MECRWLNILVIADQKAYTFFFLTNHLFQNCICTLFKISKNLYQKLNSTNGSEISFERQCERIFIQRDQAKWSDWGNQM